MATSRNQYRVLMEPRASGRALTWGRGLLVIQLLGRNATVRPHSRRQRRPCLSRPLDRGKKTLADKPRSSGNSVGCRG